MTDQDPVEGRRQEIRQWLIDQAKRVKSLNDVCIAPNCSGCIARAEKGTYLLDTLQELDRLSAALGAREQDLAEAAREIDCAGPVAHRIRVLKQENAASIGAVGRLIDERDEAWAESARLLQALEGLRARTRQVLGSLRFRMDYWKNMRPDDWWKHPDDGGDPAACFVVAGIDHALCLVEGLEYLADKGLASCVRHPGGTRDEQEKKT